MLGFTKKTDYALVALACLAEESDRGGDTLSARQIGEHYDVPVPILMNVLKSLVGGGVVRSTRGARGGYALARSPKQISMRDVIQAMEGPVKVVACCEGGEDAAQECGVFVRCPVTRAVRKLNDRIHQFLSEVTLADLMSDNLDAIGRVPALVPVSMLRSKVLGER